MSAILPRPVHHLLASKPEDAPISEPLLGFPQRRVEHEFADRLTLDGCGCLQGLLRSAAQPKVKLLGSIGALNQAFLIRQFARCLASKSF
jgi:hypothetical protein